MRGGGSGPHPALPAPLPSRPEARGGSGPAKEEHAAGHPVGAMERARADLAAVLTVTGAAGADERLCWHGPLRGRPGCLPAGVEAEDVGRRGRSFALEHPITL